MTATLPDRFAVISDIHGNSGALRAVLADIATQRPDAVVNLGDHFSAPLDAAGTWALLRDLDAVSIRGNHDRYLITLAPEEMGRSDRAAHAVLPGAALDWLRGLSPVLRLGDVFLCHATAADDETYLSHLPIRDGGVTLRDPGGIAGLLDGVDAGLVLFGHTHLPVTMRLPDGRMLVNPGSVGCPGYEDTQPVPHVVHTGTPDACYAIVERSGSSWRVEHRHVPYDTAPMAAAARAGGREGWARVVESGWYSE